MISYQSIIVKPITDSDYSGDNEIIITESTASPTIVAHSTTRQGCSINCGNGTCIKGFRANDYCVCYPGFEKVSFSKCQKITETEQTTKTATSTTSQESKPFKNKI